MQDKEFSRPATTEDLKILIRSLNKHNVLYVLIGGYALFAHGYHRATENIDILLPASEDAGISVIKALMVLPDQAAKDLKIEWFKEGKNIRLADEVIVDIMFNACGETYESLQNHIEQIDLGDLPVNTLDLEGLLKTKQTVREQRYS